MVIDKGVIAEQGTHDELVNINGVYKRLVLKQLEAGGQNKPLDESDWIIQIFLLILDRFFVQMYAHDASALHYCYDDFISFVPVLLIGQTKKLSLIVLNYFVEISSCAVFKTIFISR